MSLGIRRTQFLLFKDYLSERVQSVKIGYSKSDDIAVTYAVLQGSILGPTILSSLY